MTEVNSAKTPYNYYLKPCPYHSLDVYRVLQLFSVTSPPIQHAIKKLLFAGQRPGGKSLHQDLIEARQAIDRAIQMLGEDELYRQDILEEPLPDQPPKRFCTFPDCDCPLDTQPDFNWCARRISL